MLTRCRQHAHAWGHGISKRRVAQSLCLYLSKGLHGTEWQTGAINEFKKKPPLVEGAWGFHQGLFSLSKALSLSRAVWP